MGLLRDIREVLKVVRRRQPSKIFCPKCGSPEIHVSLRTDVLVAPKSYVCDVCGYRGLVVMELEKEEG
jgi:predicted RNA-binding Zn-ribbon protein involved in translation (DUF1610 family)